MNEFHIASYIVRSRTAASSSGLKNDINNIKGIEIHHDDNRGRLVLTIEGSSFAQLAEKVELLRNQDGVVDIALVYHEYFAEDMSEEATT